MDTRTPPAWTRRTVRLVRPLLVAAALAAGAAGLAACSSSSSSSSSTSTTAAREFQITSPAGQVSLSLNGKLPPTWPSGVPVPSGAKPAGSGSLAGSSSGVMVGVYSTSDAPDKTFAFYTSNSSISSNSASSVGSGSTFVGKVTLTSPVAADVVVVPNGSSGSLIVMIITGGTGSTIAPGGGSGSTSTSA